jgi:methylenetetrahydrofolate dehydrogenase (NADP+) / methenyltetrahydrofolate cyclohydrolase
VDGFNPINLGNLALKDNKGFIPCTPKGIIELLDRYDIEIEGRHAVVIGNF